jgi:hypothetical protein
MGIVEPKKDMNVFRGFCPKCRHEHFPHIKKGRTLAFVTGVAGFTAVTLDRR